MALKTSFLRSFLKRIYFFIFMKSIIITGSAGFIGYHISKKLLKENNKVIGIDNLNNYYDVSLKKRRNKILKKYKNYNFYKCDIENGEKLFNIIEKERPDLIIHLAAQAGVRYSLENPLKYFSV